MSFKASNYGKETPKGWMVVGDISIVILPVILGIIQSAPFESDVKNYLTWGVASVLSLIKVITQFFSPKSS